MEGFWPGVAYTVAINTPQRFEHAACLAHRSVRVRVREELESLLADHVGERVVVEGQGIAW